MNFTKDELFWIERSADIESAMCLHKFSQLVNNKPENLSKEELEMIKKMTTELIDLYSMLKELRIKLENIV